MQRACPRSRSRGAMRCRLVATREGTGSDASKHATRGVHAPRAVLVRVRVRQSDKERRCARPPRARPLQRAAPAMALSKTIRQDVVATFDYPVVFTEDA